MKIQPGLRRLDSIAEHIDNVEARRAGGYFDWPGSWLRTYRQLLIEFVDDVNQTKTLRAKKLANFSPLRELPAVRYLSRQQTIREAKSRDASDPQRVNGRVARVEISPSYDDVERVQ